VQIVPVPRIGLRSGRSGPEPFGADPGLDAELVELAYEFYAPRIHQDVMYAYGWFKPPAQPLPEGATALQRLIHLVGR
jgi:hypothetical protein